MSDAVSDAVGEVAGGDVAPAAQSGKARSRGRAAFWLGWGVLAVLVVAFGWIVVTGLLARARLTQVRAELPQLRSALSSGDIAGARALSDRIAGQTASAHHLTSGPAWWVGANLPVVGSPLRTTRVLAGAVDDVGHNVLPGVVQLAVQLAQRSHTGRQPVDVHALSQLAGVLHTSARAANSAGRQVHAVGASWLPQVADAHAAVQTDLGLLGTELGTASTAVDVVEPMLGANGPRRYFIGFENEAEARGVGGLPGAYAVATVDRGAIRYSAFGSDADMGGARAGVDLGPDYDARYAQAQPKNLFVNSDVGPDFRDTAQIWAGMWQHKTGQRIDGAIAVDPTALSYLLAVTGPARLADGTMATSANVVDLTQRDQYADHRDTRQRKAFVIAVAQAIARQLDGASASVVHAARAFSRSAQERRFVVWSSHPAEEAVLVSTGWGGAIPAPGDRPTSGFVINNAAGTKLDYYLQRTMSYSRTSCTAGSTVTASMALRNDAPTSGLPPYVTVRADHPAYRTRPGDNRLLVTYYATPGSTSVSVMLDGHPVPAAIGREHGLVTATVDVELPAQKTRIVQVHMSDPSARGRVHFLEQPGVRDLVVRQTGATCG